MHIIHIFVNLEALTRHIYCFLFFLIEALVNAKMLLAAIIKNPPQTFSKKRTRLTIYSQGVSSNTGIMPADSTQMC